MSFPRGFLSSAFSSLETQKVSNLQKKMLKEARKDGKTYFIF
ncbi:Hypothetical protein ACI5QL_00680 [Bacillus velezensis]